MGSLSRFQEWLVYRGSRSKVTGLFVLIFFISFMALGVTDLVPLRDSMRAGDPVETLFYALLNSLITGVTLVVTINQLVLSQELGPLGDQADRMDGSLGFREDVEGVISEVSSSEPSEFLGQILQVVYSCAEELCDSLEGRDVNESVLEDLRSVRDDTDQIAEELTGEPKGRFETVLLSLSYKYDKKIHNVRKIRKKHADLFNEKEIETLERLEEALTHYGPTREHIKTLYFQWDLVKLSKRLVYIAIPSTLVCSAIVLYIDASSLPGTFLGIDNLIWLVSAAATLGLTPFIMLGTYILRVGTIAKSTLAIGPFKFGSIESKSDSETLN